MCQGDTEQGMSKVTDAWWWFAMKLVDFGGKIVKIRGERRQRTGPKGLAFLSGQYKRRERVGDDHFASNAEHHERC